MSETASLFHLSPKQVPLHFVRVYFCAAAISVADGSRIEADANFPAPIATHLAEGPSAMHMQVEVGSGGRSFLPPSHNLFKMTRELVDALHEW